MRYGVEGRLLQVNKLPLQDQDDRDWALQVHHSRRRHGKYRDKTEEEKNAYFDAAEEFEQKITQLAERV